MTNSNTTSVCNHHNYIAAYMAIPALILGVILIAVSLLVIVVICRTPSLHTNTNILIASLAISDIILSSAYACIVDQGFPDTVSNMPPNYVLVKFILGAFCSSTSISIMHMGAIAIDRYFHIVHPFYYITNMTKRRIFKILIFIWIIGIILLVLPQVIYTDDGHQECGTSLHPPFSYYCATSILYIVTLILVCTSYFRIAQVSFKHRKAANSRRVQANVGSIPVKVNRFAAMRSVKFFAVMFGVFLMFTLPPMMTTAINYLYHVPEEVHFTLTFMLAINSVATCAIYIYMNRSFFLALRKTIADLRGRCCQFRN